MVTFSESFISFLRTERDKGSDVARLIMSAINLQHEYPIYGKVLTIKEVNYITMRADGLLSYLPAGKEHKTNDRGEWARDGRQSGKAGKIIRKVFTDKIQRLLPSTAFEAFGNAYKAKFLDNGFQFALKPNSAIKEVYCMERADGEASLNGSCMNDDSDYLNIYHSCPHVKILTLLNKDGQLCGRALVWNLKHHKHGDITFMDRIYVVEDYMYELFLSHAKDKGWWRKVDYKTYTNKASWINPDTDETDHVVICFDTPTDFRQFPYIDTFSYGSDGSLTNYDDDILYTYSNVDGSRDESDCNHEDEYEENHDDESWDDLAEEWISPDDAVMLSERGEYRYRGLMTHANNATEARVNRRITEWFRDGDDNIVEIDGDWYHIEHPEVICMANGEYELYDNTVCCETDGEYYLSDDSDLIQSNDGDYYHKEDDDRVIFVHSTDPREKGTYQFLPDIEDDVFQEYFNEEWFWKCDARFAKAELHVGYKCMMVYAFKTDIVAIRKGKRVKFYHERDIRITKPSTRIAQAA